MLKQKACGPNIAAVFSQCKCHRKAKMEDDDFGPEADCANPHHPKCVPALHGVLRILFDLSVPVMNRLF